MAKYNKTIQTDFQRYFIRPSSTSLLNKNTFILIRVSTKNFGTNKIKKRIEHITSMF